MQKLSTLLLSLLLPLLALASGDYVSTRYSPGDFRLFDGRGVASIWVDANDHEVCLLAASMLAGDIEKVCGVKPQVIHDPAQAKGAVIIVGTLGRSALVDRIVAQDAARFEALEGRWESFVICPARVKGVGEALLIVGSDRRGTAFGVMDLSQNIGVSPWYWWADVPPRTKERVYIKSGTHRQGPPSVRYRGVLLNDGAWSLRPWSKQTLGDDIEVGYKTYEKVFELLLRLKGNYIWTYGSGSVYNLKGGAELADRYGIVIGSSHSEPMLRGTNEWVRWKMPDGTKKGPWDWCRNSRELTEYWESRARHAAPFENTYTLGMRNVLDIAMVCGDQTTEQMVLTMQNEIIPAQREIIRRATGREPETQPQMITLYKEVLGMYDRGLQLPDDVTLMWTNDNFGYIRRLSGQKENGRSGRSGVYYHASYLGNPHEYLWLNSLHPGLMMHEMGKAYANGADRAWVLNVGGLKPREMSMDLWLSLGWDVDRYADPQQYLAHWAEQTFPAEHAPAIAALMAEYYRLAFARKPEHMGFNRSLYPTTAVADPEFSLFDHGDESARRLADYHAIARQADSISGLLPAAMRDAYFELVLYPVAGAALINEKYLSAHRSRAYAAQGRSVMALYAGRARMAHDSIISLTEYYNKKVASGKWNKMITWNPRNDQPVWAPPQVGNVRRSPVTNPGIAVEGSPHQLENFFGKRASANPVVNANDSLPVFDKYMRQSRFIDIFSCGGTGSFRWNAEPSDEWITVSPRSGVNSGDDQQRLTVGIDWDKAPEGEVSGYIAITTSDAATRRVHDMDRTDNVVVRIFNPRSPSREELRGAFVQSDGCVSIEPASYSRLRPGKGCEWRRLPGFGHEGCSMGVWPHTATSRKDAAQIEADSPAMEYDFYIFNGGRYDITLSCLPTHPVSTDNRMRYGLSVDGGQIVTVDYSTDEWTPQWDRNVLRNQAVTSTSVEIGPGRHTLKIWMADPGTVVDKIVIGPSKGYLGPPCTLVK